MKIVQKVVTSLISMLKNVLRVLMDVIRTKKVSSSVMRFPRVLQVPLFIIMVRL